jgi:hypothetical protein
MTAATDFQVKIDRAMKQSLSSLLECYWYGESDGYDEEFLEDIQKAKKKSPTEWAKHLYNDCLNSEGGIEFECGPTFEFVEVVAKAALKQVNWVIVTQHCEKLLNRKE